MINKSSGVWINTKTYPGFFYWLHIIKRFSQRKKISVLFFNEFHKYTLQLENGSLSLSNDEEELFNIPVNLVKIAGAKRDMNMTGGGFNIYTPNGNFSIIVGRPGLQWWGDPLGKKTRNWVNALVDAGAQVMS